VLLYDGSAEGDLLRFPFPFDHYHARIVPQPRPMKWGRLHDFALDCLRFGLAHEPFDAFTVVDSDQLALRRGYSGCMADFLDKHPNAGLVGSAPPASEARPTAPPALDALKERGLWQRFLRRFPEGEEKFVHWTFWPATVITANAARDLVSLWDRDSELKALMRTTRIWATEEVLLPTLIALLGHAVLQSPCSYEYVRFRAKYSVAEIDRALGDPLAFWAHPIPRHANDPLRRHIRAHFNGYQAEPGPTRRPGTGIVQSRTIVAEMRPIEGWLSEAEADLLVGAASRALLMSSAPRALVEVGSHCGKATVVLGRVAEALAEEARVYAVDTYDGRVGSQDTSISCGGPTRARLEQNLNRAGLDAVVEVSPGRAHEIGWSRAVAFLLVDGLHDYASVRGDFEAFAAHLCQNSLVAFHDYADYFPGVRRFVDGLLAGGGWEIAGRADTLIVLGRTANAAVSTVVSPERPAAADAQMPICTLQTVTVGDHAPLVSCIMPTRDRSHLVPRAIRHFLGQDYAARELVVVDDGAMPIHSLIPQDSRIRYIRLGQRLTVGAKRNLACDAATGSVILHWDDDDWMAPWRVRYQAGSLLDSGAQLAGLSSVLYHAPSSGFSWQFVYDSRRRPWVAGNTLCYRKSRWAQHPFPDIDIGEDARFVRQDRSAPPAVLADNRFIVGIIHKSNTAPKRTGDQCWRRYPTEAIRQLMGEDFDEYRRILGGGAATTRP
jgi:hypothetical protein